MPTALTMLTVTVAAVGVGVGAGVVGAAGAAEDDEVPPPPQLKSRSAPQMATPVPDKKAVLMPVHIATAIPGTNTLFTTSCIVPDLHPR